MPVAADLITLVLGGDTVASASELHALVRGAAELPRAPLTEHVVAALAHGRTLVRVLRARLDGRADIPAREVDRLGVPETVVHAELLVGDQTVVLDVDVTALADTVLAGTLAVAELFVVLLELSLVLVQVEVLGVEAREPGALPVGGVALDPVIQGGAGEEVAHTTVPVATAGVVVALLSVGDGVARLGFGLLLQDALLAPAVPRALGDELADVLVRLPVVLGALPVLKVSGDGNALLVLPVAAACDTPGLVVTLLHVLLARELLARHGDEGVVVLARPALSGPVDEALVVLLALVGAERVAGQTRRARTGDLLTVLLESVVPLARGALLALAAFLRLIPIGVDGAVLGEPESGEEGEEHEHLLKYDSEAGRRNDGTLTK